MQNALAKLHDLVSPEGLLEKLPEGFMNARTLKNQLRMRSKNGLAPHVISVGNRILIDPEAYAQWLFQRGLRDVDSATYQGE